MNLDLTQRPLWVRAFLLGIPDRTTTIAMWWVTLAASIGLPVYCVHFAHVPPGMRWPVAGFSALYCILSGICMANAVRWMDRHAAWHGR